MGRKPVAPIRVNSLFHRKPRPSSRAFTFIELLVVLLFVSLWYGGMLIELEKYVWVLEIAATVFWFATLFVFLKRAVWDITKRRTIYWNIKGLIIFLFFLHIALAFFLRFELHQSIFTAYPESFAACVVLPLILLPLYRYGSDQYGKTVRLPSERICQIAYQSALVRDFMERFPACIVYVYNHSHHDLIGTCLFQHRRIRLEREDLYEDLLLEVLINLKKRQPYAGKERFIHYLFQPYQEGSIVMDLPDRGWTENDVLDEMTLARFDQIVNSFPSLARYPLPIAIRKEPFEIVAAPV
jgi:hypothetical protein